MRMFVKWIKDENVDFIGIINKYKYRKDCEAEGAPQVRKRKDSGKQKARRGKAKQRQGRDKDKVR